MMIRSRKITGFERVMFFLSNRWPAIFFFTILVALVGCHKKIPEIKRPPVPVDVETIERKTYPAIFEYIGVVQSSHEVEIRARVTGYLDTIGYIEGDPIKKGDLLFQLDPRPFQATLAQSNAQLARENAVLWQAERSVKRFTPLYEQKAASQRDLDNAIASEMSAKAQVLAAQAQVAEAEINLDYTTIRSPVTGLTSQAKYRVGSLIMSGQEVMTTVSVVDPIWVIFSISEQDRLKSMDQLKKKRVIFPKDNEFTIEVVLADNTVYPERGIVNFASPSYSEKTGTMTIRAVLPNAGDVLRPGQFVRVKIYGATWPDAIAVPQAAVQQGKEGSFVFVVNEKNQAEIRPVTPGPWMKSYWIIWEGLNPGDKVIVKGVNKVLPGSLVKVENEIKIPSMDEMNLPQVPKKKPNGATESEGKNGDSASPKIEQVQPLQPPIAWRSRQESVFATARCSII